jgi:hypothetical protein
MVAVPQTVAPEMPPINMLDPIMRQWLDSVSPKMTRDGQTILLPLTHWPNGQEITYIGVMADEVEKIPGAVIKIDGLMFVDYEKVFPRKAEAPRG